MNAQSVLYSAELELDRDLGIEVPAWIQQDIDTSQLAAILEGGCASGAYMPAVTYHMALQTMADYGDDVLTYLEQWGELPDVQGESWAGMACRYVSTAVELWAESVADEAAAAVTEHADGSEEADGDLPVRVICLGSDDWTDQAHDGGQPEWERYGTVVVDIAGVEYGVGCVIGVRESDRESARASGAGPGPFLDAWFADASDWQDATGTDGSRFPRHSDLPQRVEDAIRSSVRKLWSERDNA